MPKISGTRSIKYTTWIKIQIGGIELTSALPSINAQNIHEMSVEYVLYVKPQNKLQRGGNNLSFKIDKTHVLIWNIRNKLLKYLWLMAELTYWEEE